jgi:hypothetical protein
MRINHKLAAVATVAVVMASGGGVAYAADASCPGMSGTAPTTATPGTTTTTAATGSTTTTAATTSSVRRHSKRHVTRHSGRL